MFFVFTKKIFLSLSFLTNLLELLSFEELDLFNDESDDDGSGSRSPGTWYFPFCSGNSIGCFSGVGSGVFVPTEIESIGDVVLLDRVCTKRSQVQSWSTRRIILAPKILIFPPGFKISFSIIFSLWPCPYHSICCNFTNNMDVWEPVGDNLWRSNSGCGDEDWPEFIWCVDVREPQFHEVWTLGEDSVTPECHPTERVDIGAGFVGEFLTNYLTGYGFRIPMFDS